VKTTQEIPNEKEQADRRRLTSGWHHTDKFGDIFVSPDGIAWAVQQSGDRLVNIAVNLNSDDIVQRPAIERVKRASAERRRYNLALAARK
jgi:hypothetical protein